VIPAVISPVSRCLGAIDGHRAAARRHWVGEDDGPRIMIRIPERVLLI